MIAEIAEAVLQTMSQLLNAMKAQLGGSPFDGVRRPKKLVDQLRIGSLLPQVEQPLLNGLQMFLRLFQKEAHDPPLGIRHGWRLRHSRGDGSSSRQGYKFC